MTDKYLLEKELMEIPTTIEAYKKYKEISEKYPILKGLEKKLTYEQFANLFFLVDHLYCYQLMWESLKSAKCDDKELEVSLKALMKDIEDKYSLVRLNLGKEVTLTKAGEKKMNEALEDVEEGRIEKV